MEIKSISDKTLVGVRSKKVEVNRILLVAFLATISFLILYPLVLLVIGSFLTSMIGSPSADFTLMNWVESIGNAKVLSTLWNTILLTFSYTLISLPISICIAWLLARTNIPFRYWLEFGFWISFFLPVLSVVQGWILLLDPTFGLLNSFFMKLFSLKQAPFDIYTWWGILFAHLVTFSISVKVMLLTPVFRNMNTTFEEAAYISGNSRLGAVIRIFIPMMAPIILVATVMSIIRGLESFEIELILGAPKRIDVYSTLIYQLIYQEPPLYGQASALGILIIFLMLLLIYIQWRLTKGKKFTTVSGKYKSQLVNLGSWKWPAFAIVFIVVTVLTVVPIAFLIIGTFMSLYGYFNTNQLWTMMHWKSVLNDDVFLSSFFNTLIISFGAAVFFTMLCFSIAYISVRSRSRVGQVADWLSWIPITLPGVLFSLAFLWFVLGTPILRPLYGSVFILILAVSLGMITLGVQMLRSNLLQIGVELEEASWTSKASRLTTFRHILLPISIQSLVVVAVTGFISAGRNVSHLVLLSNSSNRPLAILQLEYMAEGRYEAASIVGLLVVMLTVIVALLARVFGLNVGIRL